MRRVQLRGALLESANLQGADSDHARRQTGFSGLWESTRS
jgi:uncharacterized protein YjbI with pentapeptide repeats